MSDSKTVTAIYRHYETVGAAQPKRKYLGGSEIGKPCERELWYKFRGCTDESFSGRIYRLFQRGHKEEETFVKDLKAIGAQVYEVNPQTCEQFEIILHGGHFKGHADGVAVNLPEDPDTWHLLEMKTSNTRDFKKLTEGGCLAVKPVHYSQMQIYMSELHLTKALYIVVCKETDELYSEVIELDEDHVALLKAKIDRIINGANIPPRISDRPGS